MTTIFPHKQIWPSFPKSQSKVNLWTKVTLCTLSWVYYLQSCLHFIVICSISPFFLIIWSRYYQFCNCFRKVVLLRFLNLFPLSPNLVLVFNITSFLLYLWCINFFPKYSNSVLISLIFYLFFSYVSGNGQVSSLDF